MSEIKLIDIDELCTRLDIGRNTAYKLVNEGAVKAFRVGRRWKIEEQEIENYVRGKMRCL